MAKKQKKEEYVPIAMDLDADLKIRIENSAKGDPEYSALGFGDVFSNWKNFIYENSLEKTKKEFYPKIGSIINHYSGDRFKVNDIILEHIEFHPKLNDANPDTKYLRPVYVVIIEKL